MLEISVHRRETETFLCNVVLDTQVPSNHLEPVASAGSKNLHCRIKNQVALGPLTHLCICLSAQQ